MWGTPKSTSVAGVVGGGSGPAPASRVEERHPGMESLVKRTEKMDDDGSAVETDTASMSADLKQVLQRTQAILELNQQILRVVKNDSGSNSSTVSEVTVYTPTRSPGKTWRQSGPATDRSTPEDDDDDDDESPSGQPWDSHPGHNMPKPEFFQDNNGRTVWELWIKQSERCEESLKNIGDEREEFKRRIQEADDKVKANEKACEAKLVEGMRKQNKEIEKLRQQIHYYNEKLWHEDRANQALLNRLRDLEGNIRMMVRIRPATEEELERKEPLQDFGEQIPGAYNALWSSLKIPQIEKSARGSDRVNYREVTDLARVFGPEDRQYDVTRELEHLIRSALTGKDATIFAYGPSGTGKTYTMTNPEQGDVCRGIVPMAFTWFEVHAEETRGIYDHSFLISAIEVYGDEVYDLLLDTKQPQKVTIGNEKKARVRDTAAAESELLKAISRRQVGSTEKNSRSSRSHFIVRVDVIRASCRGQPESQQGSLTFVDLAGSERLADVDGKTRQEGMSINASLSDLTTMIGQLAQRRRPTPSKTLGKILKSAFTPESQIAMITCLSPLQKDFAEFTVPTLQTLSQVNATIKRSAIPAAFARPRAAALSSGSPAKGGPPASRTATTTSSARPVSSSSARVPSVRERW